MSNKKELKEAYKNITFKMGVAQIRNTQNGKIFIDSSTNLDAKWNRHRMQLNIGNHPIITLQNDWKEIGEQCFVYEILMEIEQDPTKEINYDKEIKALELLYLDELKPYEPIGYNIKTK